MREFACRVSGVSVADGGDRGGAAFDALAGLALRRNPRRPHLIVSTVLAKHVPVPARSAVTAGVALARKVVQSGSTPRRETLVVGFAETACGLAGAVADELPGAVLAHTTRDTTDNPRAWRTLQEDHSHAPAHLLLPGVRSTLEDSRLVVIVDDELSTGQTAWRLLEALHAAQPDARYVVTCLIDARDRRARDEWDRRAAQRGIDVACVSLLDTRVVVPTDSARRTAAFAARVPSTPAPERFDRSRLRSAQGVGMRMRDPRGGATAHDRRVARDEVGEALGRVPELSEGSTLVVGVEEGMYPAIVVADVLGADVQSTTRSPAVVVDHPEYPLRTGVTFPSAYDRRVPAFLYNGPVRGGNTAYSRAVLVYPAPWTDGGGGVPADLLAAVAMCCVDEVWTLPARRFR